MIHQSLLAIRIERRRISLAAFSGLRLEFTSVHELTDDPFQAATSTRKLILWALDTLKPDAVALESTHHLSGLRRRNLWRLVQATVFTRRVRRMMIRTSSVRQAMGEPPLRNQRQVRDVASTLWPRLPGTRHPSAYEAALLGLHTQMIALFMS